MEEKMRSTLHNSRKKGVADHNDRSMYALNPDGYDPDHIDPSRSHLNMYYSWTDGTDLQRDDDDVDFVEDELQWFRDRYSNHLENQNVRHKKKGNLSRIKTMDEIYQNKNYRPEETLLQIGNMHQQEKVDYHKFVECVDELTEWEEEWNASHGHPYKTLNAALHADECSLHVHRRRIWEYTDEDGNYWIGQDKALEQAGIGLPDPSKPRGRHNNRKMVYDAMVREKWDEICIAHGFDINLEHISGQHSLDLTDYIRKQEAGLQRRQHEMESKEKDLQRRLQNVSNREQSVSNMEKKLQAWNRSVSEREADLTAESTRLRLQEDEIREKMESAEESNRLADEGLKMAYTVLQDARKAYGDAVSMANEMIPEYRKLKKSAAAPEPPELRRAKGRQQTAEDGISHVDQLTAEVQLQLQQQSRRRKRDGQDLQ